MRKRPIVAAFERHYARVLGELQEITKAVVAAGTAGPALEARNASQMQERRAVLAAIELSLRLEEPNWSPAHLKPGERRQARREIDRGKLLNMAYDVLREADAPATSSAILEGLWLAGRLTRQQAQDAELRSALTELLRGQEKRGAVRSHGVRPLAWSIIKSPAHLCAPGLPHNPSLNTA